MSNKSLGRPTNDKLILSKDDILREALRILDEQGEKELSFRKLAKVFGVTAMALKHHVGSRQDIIKSLIEIVYKNVNRVLKKEDSKETIRQLLNNYCECVFKHPNVTRLLVLPMFQPEELMLKLMRVPLVQPHPPQFQGPISTPPCHQSLSR